MLFRRFSCWALAAALTGSHPATVPMSIQLPLVLRVLSAERNRPLAARSSLVIGIVYQRTSRESTEVKEQLVAEIEKRTANPWAPPVRFGLIDVSNPRDLAPGVTATKPDVLYVSVLPGFDLDEIASLSRAQKILTFTGVSSYVRLGLSVGFRSERGEKRIVLNRKASLAEGADFSSKLLRLAEVIE